MNNITDEDFKCVLIKVETLSQRLDLIKSQQNVLNRDVDHLREALKSEKTSHEHTRSELLMLTQRVTKLDSLIDKMCPDLTPQKT